MIVCSPTCSLSSSARRQVNGPASLFKPFDSTIIPFVYSHRFELGLNQLKFSVHYRQNLFDEKHVSILSIELRVLQ